MGLIVMLASSCPLHISPTLLNNNNHIPTSVGGTHSELFKYLTNPIKTFNSDNRSGSSSVISSNTRPFLITATAANQQSETENKKYDLLKAIQDTQRGLVTTADQRSSIEEALVCVEGYDAGLPIDLTELDGTWRLQYTSAPDVRVLFDAAARLPFFQVGQIYQKFECQGENNGGYVRNIVGWSIPNLLEEQEGATLLVSAKFSLVSPRNIYLQFEEITIKNIYISELVQALIAPAILPRSFLSLQLLQSIRACEVQFPVRSTGRQGVGGLYYLSYVDGNMLLGRAVGGGGVFVFTRAQTFTI